MEWGPQSGHLNATLVLYMGAQSRELEIQIYWKDWRGMCAVKFLRLEEFIDDDRHGMALHLEPKGLLFAEIKFLNPMISRKPRLQRQRKLFVHKGKNFLRPTQMNINVATWGRLMKRAMPPGCADQVTTVSPPEALLAAAPVATSPELDSLVVTKLTFEDDSNEADTLDQLSPLQTSLEVEVQSALGEFDFLQQEASPAAVEQKAQPASNTVTIGHSPSPEPIVELAPDEEEEASKPGEIPLITPVTTVPAVESIQGSLTIDHFEFISVLGRGHFGKVTPPLQLLYGSVVLCHLQRTDCSVVGMIIRGSREPCTTYLVGIAKT